VIATALVRSGADVTVMSEGIPTSEHLNKFLGGRTPLHWAAATASEGLVKLLLDSGANVNALNVTDRSPLQEAIMWGRTPVVKILLEHGASVSIKDHAGWFPLHEAAFRAQPVVTEWLLDRGAIIDAVNNPPRPELIEEDVSHGLTPLQLAVAHGRYDIYEVLKARGADIHRKDISGFSTLHIAVKGPVGYRGTVPIIRSLLDSGVDVDLRTTHERRETALHMAARKGRVGAISFLLERGADIGTKNSRGETALQIAEAAGKMEAARIISEHGHSK
jgi:ankyrin repeat protein